MGGGGGGGGGGGAVSLPVVPCGSAAVLNWLKLEIRPVRKPLSEVDKVDSIHAVSCPPSLKNGCFATGGGLRVHVQAAQPVVCLYCFPPTA